MASTGAITTNRPIDFAWITTEADLGRAIETLVQATKVSRSGLARAVGVQVSTIANWLGGTVPRDRDKFGLLLRELGATGDETRDLMAARDRLHDTKQGRGPRIQALEPTTLAPPWGDLPPHVRGRSELLDRLDLPAGGLQVIAGLGGVGKSTVALALARRHHDDGTPVWWISAADDVSLSSGMTTLARRLGASDAELTRAGDSPHDAADLCWALLDRTPGPWLVCFDNADSPEVLAPGTMSLPAETGWIRSGRHGAVLVTSRRTDRASWGRRAHVHVLDPVSTAAGGQILLDLIDGPHTAADRHRSSTVAARLGNLPLALYLTGSYLGSGLAPLTLEGLAAKTDTVMPVLDRAVVATPHRDSPRHRLGSSWQLSLDALVRHGIRHAQPVLDVLAWFAPNRPIDVALLDADALARHGMTGLTEDTLYEALVGLNQVGLITRPAAGVVVHPLVAEHTLVSPRRHPDAGVAAAASLVAMLPAGEGAATAEWTATRWQLVASHLKCLLGRAKALGAAGHADLLHAANAAAEALIELHADYATTERFIVDALGSAGAADLPIPAGVDDALSLPILALHDGLGFVAFLRGRYEEAERIFRATIAARTPLVEPDDRRLADCMMNLGVALTGLKRFDEAIAVQEQALAVTRRKFGPHAITTLTSESNYGWSLWMADRHEEAELHMRTAADAYTATLGAEHVFTMTARNNLGRLLEAMGRLYEAERVLREVAATRGRVQGDRHPETLISRHGLADVLVKQGRPAAAEEILIEVVALRREVLDPDHPHVVQSVDLLERCRRRSEDV